MSQHEQPKLPINAVWGVIDYLYHDELRDYASRIEAGSRVDNHIFLHVKELLEYLAKFPQEEKRARECLAEVRKRLADTRALRSGSCEQELDHSGWPEHIRRTIRPQKPPMETKEPEYRDHIILTLCEGDHWVAHWGLPDHSTPEYRQPDPRLQVRAGGGFLCGPYKSQDEAYAAAKCRIDGNLKGDTTTTGTCPGPG